MDLSSYLSQIKDASTDLSLAGLQQLDALEPEQVVELGTAWPDIDLERRRQVVRQLVQLVEDNTDLNFDMVFFTALNDEDATVRTDAVRGLWEYERPNLIPLLLRLLDRDEEPLVRAEAALALGRFVLLFEFGQLPERHFQEVKRGLRSSLEDDLEVEEVRARALEAIAACGQPWVSDAIQAAYEGDIPRLRVSAVHAMGRSCERRWLPLLIDELASEDPELRYEAAIALGSLEDRRAVSHLAEVLQDVDSEVKEAAVTALGQIGGSEAKTLLRRLLKDPSASVQEAAAAAMAEADFGQDPLTAEYKV